MSNVTMTAVAEHADVSRQTLYNKCPTVEAALLEYLLEEIDEMAGRIESTLTQTTDPSEQIRIFVREAMVRFAQRDFHVSMRTLMSPEARIQIEGRVRRIRQALEDVLTSGVESGHLRPQPSPARTAELMFHMIGGVGHLVGEGADAHLAATDLSGLLLEGLSK